MSAQTVETLIGISNDERQVQIRTLVEARLKNLLGGADDIPEELVYIVDEVCIARFNMLGSEGYATHNVEGESISWSEDLFAPYMDDIQTWLDAQNGTGSKAQVKFY